MSKRKGLSAEDKRKRMLDLFYEKKDFFQLKELEKLAPKEKGIISQSVKDVVQNLVDDGLVDSEKIGTSVYFWAFPSKAVHTRKCRLDVLEEKINSQRKSLKKSIENVETAKAQRENTKEREQILSENKILKEENEKLLQELKKYKDSDPEALKQLIKETEAIKEAANRWTDNIFAIKSWCRNKFSIDETTLNRQFNIPPDLDYMS